MTAIIDLDNTDFGTVVLSPEGKYYSLDGADSDDRGPYVWLLAATRDGRIDGLPRRKLYYDDADGWSLPVIRPGDRVRLGVSDLPDPVSGTVLAVYTDVLGTEVADIQLYGKRTAYQCTRFLTPAGASS